MVGVGKPLILYIRCVEYTDLRFLLIQIKEVIGVMEARRQLDDTVLIVANGGSSPPSPPKSFKFIQQFKCSSSVKIGCNYGEIAQRQSDGMKLEYRRLTRHSPTTSIIQSYFHSVKR